MQEVFNEHYLIGQDTFKVVFIINDGAKWGAGIMPYHVLEIQKLPEQTKYKFIIGEVGLSTPGYGLIMINEPKIDLTWNDATHRELTNRIRNEKIPTRFLTHPQLSRGLF